MRKLLLMSVLAVGAVNADIVPNLAAGPGAVTCDFDIAVQQNVCTYQYTATVHSETELTGMNTDSEGDFFTIYDFNGYVEGSAVAPEDWEFSVTTPTYEHINVGGKDEGSIPNLTFFYTGTDDVAGGTMITGFSAKSLFGPGTVTDWFASQSHKVGDTPGGIVQNVGPVQVPQPPQYEPGDVPEPMSMALLGGGLAALTLLPRRFRKN